MVCDGCAQAIGRKLKDLEGVVSQNVTYKNSMGVVTYDKEKLDGENIRKLIGDAGY
ncbi:MAG: cation transporter [Cytophagaceae bacterium]|nr:cation transporter [Cytophagaceae bacterium]